VQVDVSGQHFVFPTQCACCCGRADSALGVSASKSTGKKVVHTRTNVWDFPYCGDCIRHVRAAEAATALAWTLGIASVIAGGILWGCVSPYLGIPVGILALVGAAVLHNKQMAAARELCGRDCVSVERAVAYLGWHGTLHQFWIASQDYALAFMVANQRKLVNLTHAARALLESSGHGPRTGVPRVPRQHRS
jgi:hypothetical protein